MGAPVRESDDGKPSRSESPRSESPKNAPAKGTPRDVGAAPSSRATEVPHAPWKRSRQRGEVFEGDVALVELRSRLGPERLGPERLGPERLGPERLGPERMPELPVSLSTAPTFSGLPRLIGTVAMTAAVAGVAGYIWGFKLSAKIPELTVASRLANVLPALSTSVASRTASSRDFDPSSAAARTSIGLAPVDTRGSANPVASVDTAQRPALLPTPPQTVSPSVAPQRPLAAEDASVIAAKMKIGVELMTYGEITAARAMFQRVAETGDGAGAFALAETYDPLVLGGLRLREKIMPDVALARTWYENARNLGSLEARDRIARLAQLPQ
jgi:hypothetical protein